MPPNRNAFFAGNLDPMLAGGSVLVPNVVLLSPNLRAGEKILYALLLDYAQDQKANPTMTSLQEDLGCDEQQLRIWMHGLEIKQLISVSQLERDALKYEILPLPGNLPHKGV